MQIKIPVNVSMLIEELEKNGFEAYVVGGCVRDSIIGHEPNDWDITTSATPDEMLEVFKKFRVIPTGLQHGTISVIIKSKIYEITTYRVDGIYIDGRRPENVEFTSLLCEDLKRRDFTLNAMAYNPKNGLIDIFGGQEDIKNRIVRCVGNPSDRFSEDYLRILRLYRFSAVLDYSIEPNAQNVANKLKESIKNISAERIRVEFDKLLLSNNHAKIRIFLDEFSNIIFPCFYDLTNYNSNYEHSLNILELAKDSITLKLSAIFHLLGVGVGFEKDYAAKSADFALQNLKHLKYDNNTIKKVFLIVQNHHNSLVLGKQEIKKLLFSFGREMVNYFYRFKMLQLLSEKNVNEIDGTKKSLDLICEILENNEPYLIKHLEINGAEIMTLLGIRQGKIIGESLSFLIAEAIKNPELNNKESLLKILNERFGELL